MINARSRKNNDWGIAGYDFPKFNPHTDKARMVSIKGVKKQTFIDDLALSKKYIPPADYEVMGQLVDPKKHSNLSKEKRITMPMQIELQN